MLRTTSKWYLPVLMLLVTVFCSQVQAEESTTNNTSITAGKTEEHTEAKSVPPVDKRQLKCLAMNVYYEAGSEPLAGRYAVAEVTMNRVNAGFGKTPCEVIHQSTQVPIRKVSASGTVKTALKRVCQFSWVCEGKRSEPNNQRYQEAMEVARAVLTDSADIDAVPDDTLYFHSTRVRPGWGHRMVKRIGNHVFLAPKKSLTKD